nr:hypothetical protein [Malaciobacter halophilus]
MFFKRWLQGKPKKIVTFRDTDHDRATAAANDWIDQTKIEVVDIKFKYPFVIVIYRD